MIDTIKELIDKRFSKIEEYINSTSSTIHHTYISSMSFSGTIYQKVYLSLTIEVLETGEYWCTGHMSYMGYCNDESDIIHIAKSVNTEEEVIKLIEITLSIATKLNIISEQSFEVQRLGKELANIGIPEA